MRLAKQPSKQCMQVCSCFVNHMKLLCVDVCVVVAGTFTKSFGSCGGYIAADRNVIEFIKRHSPAQLYATSMSTPAVEQVISALMLLEGEDGTTRGLEKVCASPLNSLAWQFVNVASVVCCLVG